MSTERRGVGEKRTTMADLAQLAGVAKITVSRALADSASVRPEMRARIQALAREHGYQVNIAARSLRLQRTDSIAVVIEMDPSAERPMFEPLVLLVVGGLLQEVTLAGYRLVLTIRSQVEKQAALDVDGLILLGQGANDESTQRLRQFGAPMVVWGTPKPGLDEGIIFVGSDNVAGGNLVAEHVRALGRKRLLYLGDPSHPEIQARIDGIESALADSDIRVMQVPCAFSRSAAQAAVERAIAFGLAFDVVATASDEMALGVIAALQQDGRQVPQDVAVIGYDDTLPGAGITTIRQDWVRAGQELARALLAALAGKESPSVILPVELKVRSSTII
jgi:DNA-binding LacI/PurR family transcriptional regulator